MKLSLTANLVLNSVCPVLSFPERFQPITAAAVCAVAINFLEPGALMLSLSISYSYLIKCQEGMKHQMRGGATQAQQGMTFQITLIFPLNYLP
jgi:hypothetical protein